jgi:predicted unusual protein kinase regulating ubiquinone biosynthesis (AarF/ABC1/UbiB family)
MLLRWRFVRVTTFLAYAILSLWWWEIFLPHILRLGFVRSGSASRRRSLARRFREMAVDLGGVLIKLGQFLSARVDVLPPEITDELSGLQDEVPPVAFDQVRGVVESELRRSLDDLFAWFEEEPTASASLGQVHLAHLPGGELVAVKVQRPGIEAIVETDLAALRWAVGWLNRYGPLRRRMHFDLLLDEFSRSLYEELNYVSEAENAEAFARNFAEDPDVMVPLPYWERVRRRVLTLQWMQGIKINDFNALADAGIDTREVADRLFHVYLQQVFEDGFFHADPHPGNLFILPQGPPLPPNEVGRPFVLVFVDFGMVGRIPPRTTEIMRRALVDLLTRNYFGVVHAWQEMGFFLPDADLRPIVRAVGAVVDRYYGMSMAELTAIDFDEIRRLTAEFRDILFEFPFQVPQDFILLGRCLGILSGQASSLNPDFSPLIAVEPYARRLMGRDGEGADMLDEIFTEMRKQAQLLWGLPRQISQLLEMAAEGELIVRSPEAADLNESVRRLEGAVNRLTDVLVIISLLVAGSLLQMVGNPWLGLACWGVAAALLARMVMHML